MKGLLLKGATATLAAVLAAATGVQAQDGDYTVATCAAEGKVVTASDRLTVKGSGTAITQQQTQTMLDKAFRRIIANIDSQSFQDFKRSNRYEIERLNELLGATVTQTGHNDFQESRIEFTGGCTLK